MNPHVQTAQTIPNYLVYSILVTLFCCLPTGIVAIVYAAQVNGKIAAGDFQGAAVSSKNAKTWCWVSFGIGLGVTIISVAAGIFGVLSKGF
ncbi:MAG: CD225/dispanin family protein [Nitrospirae bacterium YQR-1]